MARILLDAVRHTYGAGTEAAGYALKGVDLDLEDGGAFALLGPSGCGKTTLLNILSGLVTPSKGRVLFDGEDVTGLPADRRNVAQVFQFPVVYDTMSVRENIAFPLRNRGVKGAALKARVDEILDVIGLAHVADNRARNLSAELKQKVSLGRGLVRDDVAAILFDEPLTVIDPALKWELRTQLRALHTRSRRTMIYVTHDQTEALTFADRVVVMNNGEILQVGEPADLFERPESTFVGYFIGSPGMNVIPALAEGRTARIGGREIELGGTLPPAVRGEVEIGVRPEAVTLQGSGLPVQVTRLEDTGRFTIVRMQLEGRPLVALTPEGGAIPADAHVSFDPARTHVYVGGRRVPFLEDGA
ncbi:MAG: ABC transporter ATP-binding protein [Hyphomonadaceae bacterium]